MNPIAKKIQEARLKAKMTEKELAKKCGLSAPYIIQIESGRKIINETAAAAILKVFGETMESSYAAYIEETDKTPVQAAPRPAVQPKAAPVQEVVQVEPNAQWAGALTSIIKEFQITDLRSGKMVGKKELPVLNKKIESIPWEKLQFCQVSDDEAAGLRLCKGDILWIQEMKELQGEGIYLLERQNRKQLYRIQKQHGQLALSQKLTEQKPEVVAVKDVRILGKCLRAEFAL